MSVTPQIPERIPLSVPVVAESAWVYVKECLETGWISSAGAFVGRFEEAVAQIAGVPHAVATVNGTAALHVALIVAGVRSGDGVIVPDLTFVASANAVSYVGAVPVLVDVSSTDWQLDLDLLEDFLANECHADLQGLVTPDGVRIKAILPVHVLGNMLDMKRLIALAHRFGLVVVEDSTEALGTTSDGRSAGGFGLVGAFSFNGNKILSTGGGGMIVTHDAGLAARARHLTTQAKTQATEYHHDEVGYNYRLVNVLAAIGVAQAETFPAILARRRAVDARYRQALAGVGDIGFAQVRPEVRPNGWLTTLRTHRMRGLLAHLADRGIECRPLWQPMSKLPMYTNSAFVAKAGVSHHLYEECISIPSSSDLTDLQQERVIEKIREFFGLVR